MGPVQQADGTLVIQKDGDVPFPKDTQQEQLAQPVEKIDPEIVARPRTSNAELLRMIVESGDNAKSYAQQVVEAELVRDTFDQDWRMAKIFAMSGKFADLQGRADANIATAMAKIQLGRSWGMGAADSMRYIYFTNGKPNIETELLAAKLMDAGYSWDVAYDYDEKTSRCVGATIFPKFKGESMMMRRRRKDTTPMLMPSVGVVPGTSLNDWIDVPLEVSFTKKDADGAMIWEKGKQIKLSEKWNFVSWPEDMMFWRALSRFRRRHATNVLGGAMTKDEASEIEPAVTEPVAPLFVAKTNGGAA